MIKQTKKSSFPTAGYPLRRLSAARHPSPLFDITHRLDVSQLCSSAALQLHILRSYLPSFANTRIPPLNVALRPPEHLLVATTSTSSYVLRNTYLLQLYVALYLSPSKHLRVKKEPIEMVLDQQFGALGRDDEFRELMGLFDHLLSLDAPIERSIGACWERITERALWRDRYTSLASFKGSVGVETLTRPAIAYRDHIDHRKRPK